MKKIMSFVLAVLILASAFGVTILAATPVKSQVEAELAQLKIDGAPFNEANYPVDKNRNDIQVLAVAERGFNSLTSTSGFGLFIYIYNPSCIAFDDAENDVVNIAINLGSESYSSYGLEVMSKSRDHRFYKFRVKGYHGNALSNLCKLQDNENERVYSISALHLVSSGASKSYPVGKMYICTGLGDSLVCSERDFDYIEVELRTTSWVSPNAGDTLSGKPVDKYDHYEVHSVYFAIDREYYGQYEYLSSIRASFQARKFTPILVAPEGSLSDDTVKAIEAGEYVSGKKVDVNDLAAIRLKPGSSLAIEWIPIIDWWYSESDINFGSYSANKRYDQLVYLFENSSLPKDFDMEGAYSMLGASSADLEKYCKELLAKNFASTLLYSKVKPVEEVDYKAGEMLGLKDAFSSMSKFQKWWYTNVQSDSYLNDTFTDREKITVIKNPSKYANVASNSYKAIGDELLMNECDVKDFSDFCKTAVEKDQVVVVLRYGVSDYRCVPVYDSWEFLGAVWQLQNPIAVSVEKWGYFDVSLAQIGFTTAGVETIVPVVSNRVDSYGDVIIFDVTDSIPGIDFDRFLGKGKNLLGSLKMIFIVLMIVSIVVVIIIALPKVIGATKSARTNRRLRDLEKKSDKPKENNNKKE